MMKRHEYTPEHICKAMGVDDIPQHETLGTPDSLRILLRPSFHPEVCLTFVRRKHGAVIQIATFRDMLFHQAVDGNIFPYSEEQEVPLKQYAHLIELCRQAVRVDRDEQRHIILDGMPFTMWIIEHDQTQMLESKVWEENPLVHPIREAITLAYASLKKPSCKNAVAVAGQYVGLEFEQIDISEELPTTHVLLLDSQEDTESLSNALKKSVTSTRQDEQGGVHDD